MLLKEVYRSAKVVGSGTKYTTVNEFTDQLPALRPQVLWEAALEVVKAGEFDVDKIVTEEDKGAPLGALVSVMTNRPLAVARWYPYSLGLHNEVKVAIKSEYYQGTLYLNGIEKGDRVAIVDDTISTGGALVALINAVRQAGGHVTEVICVVEKIGNNGVRKVYDETGITVRSILKIHVSENGVDVHDE